MARAMDERVEIDRAHPVPRRVVEVVDDRGFAESRVVDDDVDSAVSRNDVRHDAVDLVALRHVDDPRRCSVSPAGDGLPQCGVGPAEDAYRRTLFQERDSDGSADTRAAAGHDDHVLGVGIRRPCDGHWYNLPIRALYGH